MITFLLTDVVGSTPLWDADPQSMHAAITRHDEIAAAVVGDHAGRLVKSRGEGDSTFSVFDRVIDAAVAALEFHHALEREMWPGGLSIVVRAGIHLGEVEVRADDFYGPAVNRAARLRSLAAPGETLVSRSAMELLADHGASSWRLEEVGMRALKGLSRPEHVFRLRSVDESASEAGPDLATATRVERRMGPLPTGLLGDGGPFIGRVDLLHRLWVAWSDVAEGGARAVLLGGEPGIGKTSVASALARHVREQGATVLYGRSDEAVAVAYEPFLDAITALVDQSTDADLAADPRTAAELTRLIPELADRLADLPEPIAGEPDAERHALFDAVLSIVERHCARAPTLFVVDDLHWATLPTVFLLGRLLRRRVPGLLVVGTYRDTEVDVGHALHPLLADAWRIPGVERIDLRGLDRGDVALLLEEASGREMDDAGRRLAAVLDEGTGGNPFFVLAMLRHLAETGAIHESDGRWTTELDVARLEVPASVADVLGRRLARLSADARRYLTVAAVAGADLDLALVTEVAGQPAVGDALDHIEAAADAGLVVEKGGGFAFAHALVRQALLASLSTARRRNWHRQLGEALSRRPPGHRPVEALAMHWTEAAAADPSVCSVAAAHGLEAAQRAARSLAHEEALEHIDRALRVLDDAIEPDLAIRSELLLTAAATNFALVGRTDGCRRPALAAASDALEVADPVRVARAAELAMGGLVMTYDTAGELRILDAALRLPTTDAVRARLTAARALALLGAGRDGDQEEAERAVAMARAAGDDGALTAALHARSASLLRSPDLAARLEVANELRTITDRDLTASRVALSPTDVELYAGAAHLADGDLAGLENEIALLEELHDANRDWELRYFAIAHRATLAVVRGDVAELERRAEEMILHDATRPADPELRSFRPVSDGSSIGNNSLRLYAAYQFILHRERGELEAILPVFRQAVVDDPSIAVFAAALAIAEAEVGQRDAARASLDRLLVDGIAALPHDQIWPLLLGVLCDGCALVDAAAHAPAIRAQTEPYSGQISCGAIATITYDLFDRCLGMLDVVEERWDDAADRFGAAIDQARSLGAPVFEARASAVSAHAHRRRGRPGDAAWADELHVSALSIAQRLRLAGLEAWVLRWGR